MSTALPSKGARDVLFVVDLSGYVFRAYHAIAPLSSPTGEPTHATYGTITMLRRLIDERKPHMMAVAMDSKGPSFRKILDDQYKANRPPPPPDLSVQMERCREIVEGYRIPIWQKDGFEADDLIASGVAIAKAHNLKVVIVSADKDLMQLIDDQVISWDTMRNKVFGPAEVQEKFGVPPSKLGDFLAFTGDSSDNIPGVPSVGAKTAAQLLTDFASIDDVYANLDKISRVKLRDALRDNEKDARHSRVMVTLVDNVALDFSETALAIGEPDAAKLIPIFQSLNFTKLLASVGGLKAAAPPVAPTTCSYRAVIDTAALDEIVAQCTNAGSFAFDTETTSTDAMRASLVGISLCCSPGDAVYIPISHRYLGAPQQLDLNLVRSRLAPLFANEKLSKYGHNLKYDETVLRRHGFPAPNGAIEDTMIASYLLDPEALHGLKDIAKRELGVEMTSYEKVTTHAASKDDTFEAVPIEKATEYAAADADMTLRLERHLAPMLKEKNLVSLQDDLEIPLSRMLVDLEMTGVRVDVDRLRSIGAEIDKQIVELDAKARQLAGHDFNVNSPRQLETILFDELKLTVIKKTKSSRSTDASVLEALADEHPLPATILEQRQLAKLKNTYIDTLPKLVHPQTGRIHTHFNQSVAATGRLSSSDPNFQNIPIRTEIGKSIRSAFIAEPGFVLLSADYSQIELRVLAHLAHDPVLIESFCKGEDVHTRTAKEIFEVNDEQVTSEMRRQAKAINFGVIYGMGEMALAKRLGIKREQAGKFIKAYFERYQAVKVFMEATLVKARVDCTVGTLLGRLRHLPDLRSPNRQLRAQAERIACNTPIQGTAADILKLAMVKLREPVVEGARMILTVHDELVFEIPEGKVEEARAKVKDGMENVVKLDVPLIVEVGVGKNWAEAH